VLRSVQAGSFSNSCAGGDYVYDQTVTQMRFNFGVDGELIDFRAGELQIGIHVEQPGDHVQQDGGADGGWPAISQGASEAFPNPFYPGIPPPSGRFRGSRAAAPTSTRAFSTTPPFADPAATARKLWSRHATIGLRILRVGRIRNPEGACHERPNRKIHDVEGAARKGVARHQRREGLRVLVWHDHRRAFIEGQAAVGAIAITQVDDVIAKHQAPYVGKRCVLHIERIVPLSLLAFRWHPGADAEAGPNAPTTLVTFALEAVPEGTRLTITESGFDSLPPERRAKAFRENEGGWEAQLGLVFKYLQLLA
jgi:hypothetical protein